MKILRLLICAGSLLALNGCGGSGDYGTVTGTVTLDGQPLPNATVTFVPTVEGKGSTSRGRTDDTGKYELIFSRDIKGAEIGDYKVAITTYDSGNPDGDPPTPKVPEKVPMKYNTKTDLKASVKSGGNTHDFAVKKDGPILQPEVLEKQRERAARANSCE